MHQYRWHYPAKMSPIRQEMSHMDGIIGCFGSLNLLNLLINKISKMDPVKPMGSGRATWINLLVLVLGRVFETIKIRTSQNAQVMILSTLW